LLFQIGQKRKDSGNFNIFDFELSSEDMEAVATLDTKTSSFFDHRDPEIVKWMGSRIARYKVILFL